MLGGKLSFFSRAFLLCFVKLLYSYGLFRIILENLRVRVAVITLMVTTISHSIS